MIPRGLMIALCTGAIVAQAHAAAIPAPNDYIVFRDDPPKVTPDVIPNVAIKPFESIKVTEMRVRSEIALRYARTSVVTHVRNPDARPQEATFRMLLPDTAFISNFTMILGGTSYTAYVEKKEEAAQIYRQAVSQGIGAAHVATKARDSYEFMVSVNVEGNTTAVFDLRYEEFLVRRNGLYNHAINLHPGSFVPKMEVVVHIKESQKIMKLHVPELRTGNEVDATEHDKQNSKAVTRYGTSKREVTVTFAPDLQEQEELARIYERKSRENGSLDMFIGYSSDEAEQDEVESRSTLLGQFVVQYDVERTNNGEILVNDGYFVHFLAPSSLPPLSKYVVFVLDTSGSMYGRKIEQLRNAMTAILSDLNPNDYFNIVEFNSVIKIHDLNEADEIMSYTDYQTRSLVPPARATPENINRAKLIVSEFDVSGATDIYGALDVALNLTKHDVPLDEVTESANRSGVPSSNHENMTKAEVTSEKVECEPIIIFLTDGDANLGEMNNSRIISLITAQNSGGKRASIYSLAFGEDADRVFLRELSLRNEGFMRHIYEAADAALQLRDFYRQVSSPLLADVKFLYPSRQIKEDSVSRSQFRTVNDGAELAVVGRVAEGVKELTPRVLALRAEREGRGRKVYETSPTVVVTRGNDSYLPLERLWAYLTIKQLLDKRDAGDGDQSGSGEDKPEKKALAIALKYSFVTPLTSLVVVRLNKTDVEDLVDAETVDDPKFLPYRSAAQPLTHEKLSFSASPSGTELAISSSTGPVLFVQSGNRLTSTGVAYGYGTYGTYGQSQQGFASSGASYAFHSSSMEAGLQNSQSGQFSQSGQANWQVSSSSGNDDKYIPDDLAVVQTYHLQGYEWILWYVNTSADAFEFPAYNVSMKISKDPSQKLGNEYECWPENPSKIATCVYLTRCRGARIPYSLSSYIIDWCFVGVERYAGVCCPPDQIDKALNQRPLILYA